MASPERSDHAKIAQRRTRLTMTAAVAMAVLAGTTFGIWQATRTHRSAPEAAIGPSTTPPTAIHSSSPPATPTPPRFGLTSLKMITPAVGWAMGRDTDGEVALSRVLRTTDGGATWSEVTPSQIKGDRSGLTAFFLDESRAWVARPRDRDPDGHTPVTIFATTDGGETWRTSSLTSSDGWDGQLFFLDGQHGWSLAVIAAATGNDPVEIWRTTDAGRTWEFMSRSDTSFFPGLPPGTPGALPPCGSDIAFLDRETGFASSLCASATQLFVTHDAGRTWSSQPVSPRPAHAGGPTGPPGFVSRSDGFWTFAGPQLGPGTRIYATHDSGRTWTSVDLPASPMNGLPSFIDGRRFVYYARPMLMFTSDGGASWNPIAPDVQLDGTVLDFVDLRHGWALSRDPYEDPFLLATTDGGHTWVALQLTLAG